MQTSLSSRDARARWQRRWPLLVLAIVVPVIAYFALRPRSREEQPTEPGAGDLAEKPRYQNRAVWQSADGSRPRVPLVKGTVYAEGGHPVEGVTVSATTFAIAGNQNHLAGRVKTDHLGKFELNLPDGTYFLNADKEGYGSTLALAHSGDEIGMVLLQSGAAEGKITNERGEPVTRFSIDMIGPSTEDMAAPAPFVSKRFESADGSYRMTQLPDRPMYLRVTAEGYAPAYSDPMKPAPGVTHRTDLTLTAGCVLTGTVEDESGKPLVDVLVDAEMRKSAGVIGDTSLDAASKDVTGTDGAFRLANVPTGSLLVTAYEMDHAPTDLALQIERCEDVKPIVLRMSAGGGLSGVVRDRDGNPVAGAKMMLMNRVIGFVNTRSDKEGKYRFDRLPAGTMRVEAHRGVERIQAQLAIEADKVTERDLTFSPGGEGEIAGRIVASGKPLSGVQLLIAKSAGDGLINMFYPVTGPDGTYKVTGLIDGMYAVLVSSMNQVSSARIDSGSKMTVDFEVTHRPVVTLPDIDVDEDRNLDEEQPM